MCDHTNDPGGREAAMVEASRGVWCDPCIAPLVKALNEGGLNTVASCCGHGKRPGKIALKDGRELFILPDFDSARQAERDSRPTYQQIQQVLGSEEAVKVALTAAWQVGDYGEWEKQPVGVQAVEQLRIKKALAALTQLFGEGAGEDPRKQLDDVLLDQANALATEIDEADERVEYRVALEDGASSGPRTWEGAVYLLRVEREVYHAEARIQKRTVTESPWVDVEEGSGG